MVLLGGRDAAEVLTLQRAAYLTEAAAHGDFKPPPLTQTLAGLAAELAMPAVSALGALGVREAGRMAASARLYRSGDAVKPGRLIVASDRQGQGLGSHLLRYAETVFPDCRGNLSIHGRAAYGEYPFLYAVRLSGDWSDIGRP